MAWEVKWCAQGHGTSSDKGAIQGPVWFQMQSSTATLQPKSSSQRTFLIPGLCIKHILKSQPPPGRRLPEWPKWLSPLLCSVSPVLPPQKNPAHWLLGQSRYWEGSVYFGTLAVGNSINEQFPSGAFFPPINSSILPATSSIYWQPRDQVPLPFSPTSFIHCWNDHHRHINEYSNILISMVSLTFPIQATHVLQQSTNQGLHRY